MDFNDYLDPLVNVEGATSISIILLVDVDVGSFSPNKYVPTPWAKHIKTTVRGAPSLRNPSCSKLDFSPLAVAVAVVLPSVTILSFVQQVEPTPTQLLLPWLCGGCTGRPKDEDEVITKLPPVRNIVVVYSFLVCFESFQSR